MHSELNEIDPLTPNKILKAHINPRLHLVNDCHEDDPLWTQNPNESHEQLNATLAKHEKMTEHYKNMWYGQYLLGLRETTRDVFQSNWEDKISVGDIVLVDTKSKPRVYWQLGRVVQLLPGNDGHVRQVILKTANNQAGRYSVKLLYPLEIQSTHTGQSSNSNQDSHQDGPDNSHSAQVTQNTRPKWQAELNQNTLIKGMIRDRSL